MWATIDPDASYRALQRRFARATDPAAQAIPLERAVIASEPPRLVGAEPLEGDALSAHRVTGPPIPRFAAFLDGTQASRVLAHRGGIPIIHGTVAAVVRRRADRRMSTWKHLVAHAVHAPRAALGDDEWRRLEALGAPLVDSSESGPAPAEQHPFSLRDAAVHQVQRARERLEHRLAAAWCEEFAARPASDALLFVDGSISGSEALAGSPRVVGVVKSHRSLYALGDDLRRVLALRAGERSSVFRVRSSRPASVASWYLRLRDPASHDPMWGLVRVEIAESPVDGRDAVDRADEVSRWILAEVAPLSLPDARWDKMVYGIRDCEEFLRAVV